MNKKPKTIGIHWLTVGGKLLLGVALASNCFIGALLLVNHRATTRIDGMMAEVLAIREGVDAHLRQTIVRLQQEFVALPALFAGDPKTAVLEQVERKFQVRQRERLSGRDSYASLYSRAEKRDLANGRMIAGIENGILLLTQGLFDDQGAFTAAIERLHLASHQPEMDLEGLRALIESSSNQVGSPAVLEEKIGQLRGLAADKSIEAENSRIEILGYIDDIKLREQRMGEASRQQRRFSLTVGLAAIAANILVLFFLTRSIVEKPLHRLTSIVEALSTGQYPEIPWQGRRDQIGVLCAAIGRFRDALLALKGAEERQAEDRQRIEGLVRTMTVAIRQLNDRAGQMAAMSHSLQELAGMTRQESANVAGLASDTARRTEEVGSSSRKISTVADAIHRELAVQNREETQIQDEIEQARRKLDSLSRSVAEIDGIVVAVHAITDQTKILAINATIEAVKAGEHGRGFAVVADEVKKLSQSTAHATRDVLEKIGAINATCRFFIDSFDALDSGAERLKQVTATIGQAVGGQRELTGAIVRLAEATGENTREVSTRITEVNGAAAEVLQLADDARRYAEEIATHLGDLLSGSVRDLETMSTGDAAPAAAPVARIDGCPAPAREPSSREKKPPTTRRSWSFRPQGRNLGISPCGRNDGSEVST